MSLIPEITGESALTRTPAQSDALAELLPFVRDRRAEIDARLSLGEEVMDLLRRTGVFRGMVS